MSDTSCDAINPKGRANALHRPTGRRPGCYAAVQAA